MLPRHAAKISACRRQKGNASFNAWSLQVIGKTISGYETAATSLKGKQKVVVFDDINISMVVEKKIDGHNLPIPMIIEKAQQALNPLPNKLKMPETSFWMKRMLCFNKRQKVLLSSAGHCEDMVLEIHVEPSQNGSQKKWVMWQ